MPFILRRLFIALITLFLVSVVCFFSFSVIRGDPASTLGGIWISPEQLSELREEMGLNKNVFVRYFDWLFKFISGNPGYSYSFRGEEISSLLFERLPVSFTLALLSLLLILLISVPLSLLTVKKKGNITDITVNIFTAAGVSTPGFFIGLLFIFFFGFTFNLFVPGYYTDYRESFPGFLKCLFFPALAIAIPNTAILTKFLRGSLFSELDSDYVRTARSKGAGRLYIMRHHVLKNACLPAVTVFGMIIAEVFSGSIIIEQVFSIPGIGRLLIAAIGSRDYPLIQSLLVYIAFIVVFANTLADIVNLTLDPRIRRTKEIN